MEQGPMDLYDYAEKKGISVSRVMDFRNGANPLGPSLKARHAVRKAVRSLSCAPDSQVRHLSRFICKTVGVASENLLLGSGRTQLLAALVRTRKPSMVAVPLPVSRDYRALFASLGVAVQGLPAAQGGRCFSGETLVPVTEKAGLILLPYPHDVTGTHLRPEELAGLIRDTRGTGQILVIDEAYLGYTDLPSPVQEVVGSDGAIILRSLSTCHALAGLPIGYALGPRSLLEQVKDALAGSQVNSLASAAALASLRDDAYPRRSKAFIEAEKRFMRERIARMKGFVSEDTPCNFILLHFDRLPAGLETPLRDRGILVDEYLDAEGHPFLRIPVRSHKFNARFLKALGGISKEVNR